MDNEDLLKRITFNPAIFGGKPIIRGMRIAVEHILGMLCLSWVSLSWVRHESVVIDQEHLSSASVHSPETTHPEVI